MIAIHALFDRAAACIGMVSPSYGCEFNSMSELCIFMYMQILMSAAVVKICVNIIVRTPQAPTPVVV